MYKIKFSKYGYMKHVTFELHRINIIEKYSVKQNAC